MCGSATVCGTVYGSAYVILYDLACEREYAKPCETAYAKEKECAKEYARVCVMAYD